MRTALSVLLVEDDESDASLLECELTRGGYDVVTERVQTADSMQHALEQWTWDVVIADYSLPSFSATAALEIVKGRGLDLPFIIVSGTIDEEAAVASLKAGAHDFLTKRRLARLVPAVARELREAEVRRERRRVEAALHESDARYRMVAEHASDVILITDPSGIIQYANPVTLEIFGVSPAEVIGHPLTTLVRERLQSRDHPRLSQQLIQHRADALPQHVELIGSHKSGHVLRLNASVGSATRNGAHVCICILRDVTERRNAEIRRAHLLHRAAKRARRAAEAACLEAERANLARAEFVATVSHELRTPLAAIIGYAELLTDDRSQPLSDPQRTQLDHIATNGQRLLTLIDEILTFSAVDAGNTKYTIADVTLAPIVRAVADAIAPAVEKQALVLALAPHDPLLKVRADAGKLQQVLGNVLGNAVKFSASGGVISLSCEETVDAIRIHVRDTGCGMRAEHIDTIFDPFVQLDTGLTRQHGGVGLGLAISREFMRGMGGTLEVESALGVGTVFTITLPVEGAVEPVRLLASAG